ncbi:MAG: DNA-protecting protein DprA [Candidatus Sungbacteria bacterium]|nr:DNA-protecting protein DprA [Candidatus Sungbacteria bacterium]
MNSDLPYLHAFNLINGVGAASFRALRERFGSYETAWLAAAGEIRACGLRQQDTADAIIADRPTIHPQQEYEKVLHAGVWLVTDTDESYPLLLKEIPNPPAALYGKGAQLRELFSDESISIGIVGTRRTTAYGLQATEKIVADLVSAGTIITSGLALGIDTKAHQTALDGKGTTIAVVGSGLDESVLFPHENIKLSRKIIESGGTILSEYPPFAKARREYFPMRNRILSGLSRGIVVIEAREKSGALITARFALEQNREVFAVPGSIFSPTSHGPNALIREGAKLIASAADILDEFGIVYQDEARQHADVSKAEETLLILLEEAHSVDEMKRKLEMQTADLLATLSLLELKGLVRIMGVDMYQKV